MAVRELYGARSEYGVRGTRETHQTRGLKSSLKRRASLSICHLRFFSSPHNHIKGQSGVNYHAPCLVSMVIEFITLASLPSICNSHFSGTGVENHISSVDLAGYLCAMLSPSVESCQPSSLYEYPSRAKLFSSSTIHMICNLVLISVNDVGGLLITYALGNELAMSWQFWLGIMEVTHHV